MTARHIVRAAAELEIVRALDYYAINAPGKLADFALLDPGSLTVRATVVGGTELWRA